MDIISFNINTVGGVVQGQDEATKQNTPTLSVTEGTRQGDEDPIQTVAAFTIEQPSFLFVA